MSTEKLDIVISGNADGATRAFGKAREGVKSISDQLGAAQAAFQRLVGAAVAFQGVQQTFATTDSYASLTARLKLATQGQEEFRAAYQGVLELANTARAPLEETAQLYTRLAGAVRTLGGTQRETLGISEAVALSLRVSGASAQESAAALLQFAQALGSGVLQGDELRSLGETAPRLLKAIADGAGLSVGSLKSLGAEGKLTADVIGNALLKSLSQLRVEAQTLPNTVGGAFVQLSNAVKQYVGEADQASGRSQVMAGAVQAVARNFAQIAEISIAAGTAVAAVFAGRAVSNAVEFVSAQLAARQAAVALATAQAEGAATALAAARAQQVFAAQVIQAQGTSAAATAAYAAAQTQAAVATTANTAAQARLATVLASGGVAGALRGVLGLLGGPVGIVVTLGLAAAAWALFGQRAETAADKAAAAAKRIAEDAARLGREAQFGAGDAGIVAEQAKKTREEIARLEGAQQRFKGGRFAVGAEEITEVTRNRRLADAKARLAELERAITLADRKTERVATPAPADPGFTDLKRTPSLDEVDKEFKTRFTIEKKFLEDRKRINAAYDAERAQALSFGDDARVAELESRRKQNLAAAQKERDDALKGTVEKDRLAQRRELYDADLVLTRARIEAERVAYTQLYTDQLLTTEEFFAEKRRLQEEDAVAEARDLNKRKAENESYLAALNRALPKARDKNERLEVEDKIFEAKNKQKQIDTELAVLASKQVSAAAELGAEAEKVSRERAALLAQTQRSIREKQGQGTDEDVRASVLEKNRELLRTLAIEFGEAGRQAGEKIVDLEVAESQLRTLEAKFSDTLNRMKTVEESLNIQRQAGLLTEYDARERIIELYRTTGAELDLLIPKMQSLAASSGNSANVTAAQSASNRVRELVATQGQAETQIRGGLTDAFKGLFTSIATGAKGGKDALLDMLGSFARKALDVINQRLAEQLVNGFFNAAKGSGFNFGGLFGGSSSGAILPGGVGAAPYHTGGIVGSLSTTRRTSPLLFAGAPRYHTGGIVGLRPNEIPMIGKKGEEMITEDDPRHARNGGGAPNVSVTVHAGDAQGTPPPRIEQFGRVIAQLVTQEIANQKRPGGLLAG